MYPSKIISGGQTGADRAGLYVGKSLGLETGGIAPYNWITDGGPNRTILEGFGLIEGPYDPKTYPKRTRLNVADSHGTLLVGNVASRGSRLTASICLEKEKPLIENPSPERLRDWLHRNKIQVLNVAGNRERTNPGIFERTVTLLTEVLESNIRSYDMICPNCENRRNIEMTLEDYETTMDDGGYPCTATSLCIEKMQPFSALE